MKSRNWLVYTIIFIFSAIYVFNHEKYTKRIEIINGYCENFSVNRGQDLEFYISPDLTHKRGVICIYNSADSIIDSLILNLKTIKNNHDSLTYEHGFNFSNKFTYNTSKLKAGIYFIGKKVPFIVKDPNLKNAITIIFPFANFHTWSNQGGKSFSVGNSTNGIAAKTLSLKRNPYLSNNPKAFINWIDSVMKGKSINIISDIDLETNTNITNSKLLVFFGNMGFGSKKQNLNLIKFVKNGGNVLSINSRFMNSEIAIDRTNKTIENISKHVNIKYKQGDFAELKVLNPFWQTFGCDYRINYDVDYVKKSLGGYAIIKPQHKIFTSISSNFIPFENSYGTAFPVKDINFNQIPQADNSQTKFYNFEILAYDYATLNEKQSITGIFEIKRSVNSGKIIVIGNEKWGFEDRLNKDPIKTITLNCINYLYKN